MRLSPTSIAPAHRTAATTLPHPALSRIPPRPAPPGPANPVSLETFDHSNPMNSHSALMSDLYPLPRWLMSITGITYSRPRLAAYTAGRAQEVTGNIRPQVGGIHCREEATGGDLKAGQEPLYTGSANEPCMHFGSAMQCDAVHYRARSCHPFTVPPSSPALAQRVWRSPVQ